MGRVDPDTGATECYCGTIIPASGTAFDPGCRHCARLRADRLVREVDE